MADSSVGQGIETIFSAGEIHGDMDQSSRIAELDRFKAGTINILVCSDVAARGLDIKGVSHVFNYDTPWHPDDYVHRIGRTGRAGATGKAFTLVAPEDAEAIANVEKLTGLQIPVYEIGGKSAKAEPAPREDKPARVAKPARAERAPRAAKPEPEVAEAPEEPLAEAAPRVDRHRARMRFEGVTPIIEKDIPDAGWVDFWVYDDIPRSPLMAVTHSVSFDEDELQAWDERVRLMHVIAARNRRSRRARYSTQTACSSLPEPAWPNSMRSIGMVELRQPLGSEAATVAAARRRA